MFMTKISLEIFSLLEEQAMEKTFFTQKLAVNNFFGTFKKVEWVSSIELSTEREAEIESFFV